MPRDLLIIGCSDRKLATPSLAPAIERYDGPMFRMLRKLRREERLPLRRVDILILSAKYGVVTLDQSLPYYNLRLTPALIPSLADATRAYLSRPDVPTMYAEGLIAAGELYRAAAEGLFRQVCAQLTVATGGIGCKIGSARSWLMERG